MHAEEIHSHLETETFSPFRDIWMPLDLSNIASFNGIMAHAAAHLSQIQHKDISPETLRYKTEIIELVNRWLGDPNTAFKDEVFAAILRLFTFEVCQVLAPLDYRPRILTQINSIDIIHARDTGEHLSDSICINTVFVKWWKRKEVIKPSKPIGGFN